MRMLLRSVALDGDLVDVRIADGRIAQIGRGLSAHEVIVDGDGGALIPGLADHHLHILATAARRSSVVIDDVVGMDDIAVRLAKVEGKGWIRAVDCPATLADTMTCDDLDAILPDRPLRMQDQTGALWLLNGVALDRVLGGIDADGWPASVERDGAGRPTGRIWRGDDWLRGRLVAEPPDLAPLGRELARYGVTALADASVSNDPQSAMLLAHAVRTGALPQKLMLMSGGPLEAPADLAFTVGPVKILIDASALPPFDIMVAKIADAHENGRMVAVHCVTATELAFTLAAFAEAGCRDGDRIEHGSVIPPDAIGAIRDAGLRVVTQAGFIAARGDRYLRDVATQDQPDLYRAASLLRAGVRVAGSSDAPYGPLDPWISMATSIDRRAPSGAVVGAKETLTPIAALDRYLSPLDDPGGAPRHIAIGEPADLCLLDRPLDRALAAPSSTCVKMTMRDGRILYHRA
ncbi:amidohydrolase family protein [Sphingobium sp. UBA5915]|jgi:YD repeat-containing protein|uniref:amidohydrolase family protein n=1 Tax=Sphingobium sp. UBA5915 TaxID=1947530 RepID=UPI000C4E8206|nr:amidohydrolase family protein [Sphingobium sp. UBA5915]MBS48899.1 amidohydrolase [Sphingobium sp.]HCW62076.1 amidohydrolase [Sphingobium sp.]